MTHKEQTISKSAALKSFDFKLKLSHRILTAAHCVTCDNHGCPIAVDVYVGNVKSQESTSRVVKAQSWMVDETYSESSEEHDLALSK